MRNKQRRSSIGIIIDTITFPLRAVFLGGKGIPGLSTHREERMRIVESYCKGRVLDIGCGPGNVLINDYVGSENGIGIDVYPYDGVDNIVEDMSKLPFKDGEFDTVALVAVGGHIPRSKRAAEFKEFARVLRPGGNLVMTEGEPITQYLHHKWQGVMNALGGKIDMDSERGMEEEEEYCMPNRELVNYLQTAPLFLTERKRMVTQWGLNSVYVATRK